TPQSRVKHLGDVGRTDDDDLAARDKAVHQAEKLRHNALFDLADHFGAFGRHSIDLVDEEDRRRVARRFLEDLAELGLALAVELPHNFRAVEVNEVHAAFRRYGAGEQGLACAWRTVQQHTLRRENSQPLEDARVLQRQLYNFAYPRDFTLQAADIFVGHRRRAGCRLLALHDPDVGAFPDHDRSRRNRAHNLEVHRLGKRWHTDHAARDDRDTHQILEHPVRCDGRWRGPDPQRRESNSHRLLALDSRHRHLLLQPRATIAAAGAVHLDHAFVSCVRKLGAPNTDRASCDLQHVACSGTHTQQVGWRQSRNGVADVLDTRLRNAQCEGCRERRGGDFRHGVPCNLLLAIEERRYHVLLHVIRLVRRDSYTGHIP